MSDETGFETYRERQSRGEQDKEQEGWSWREPEYSGRIQANQCPGGGECASNDVSPNAVVSMLQATLQMNVPGSAAEARVLHLFVLLSSILHSRRTQGFRASLMQA